MRRLVRASARALNDALGFADGDFALKVRRRMRGERDPRLADLVDKFRVKDYARARGVRTARTLFVTDRPELIPFDSLPRDYFIKANHGWRWNIRCQGTRHVLYGDGRRFAVVNGSSPAEQGRTLSREAVVRRCANWLDKTHSPREWAYRHVVRRILVEERLISADGGELKDYRAFTFGGKVRAIGVGSPSLRRARCNVFFDPTWREIPLTSYRREARPSRLPERPARLPDLIRAAERLGEGLDFVRVDLYETTRGVALGELTLYPEAGRRRSPSSCSRLNRWLGRQWSVDRTHYVR